MTCSIIWWAVAKRNNQWMDDLFFNVKLAWLELSNYSTEVTPTTGMFLISAHILDYVQSCCLFGMWDKGMDIHSEDSTFYTTHDSVKLLKCVQNEYGAKFRPVLVNEPETYWAVVSSHPQLLEDLVNQPSIHIICPAMMTNITYLTTWLNCQLDEVIQQDSYWPPLGSIIIRRL